MADADVPVKYMDRTRHYYRALAFRALRLITARTQGAGAAFREHD
jgi:hypothetical protein